MMIYDTFPEARLGSACDDLGIFSTKVMEQVDNLTTVITAVRSELLETRAVVMILAVDISRLKSSTAETIPPVRPIGR